MLCGLESYVQNMPGTGWLSKVERNARKSEMTITTATTATTTQIDGQLMIDEATTLFIIKHLYK